MKKINQILIDERLLLEKAIEKEEILSTEGIYTTYHSTLANWYKNVATFLDELIGLEGNIGESAHKISTIDFTENQILDILQLQNSPLYKKALGEAALTEIEEIEDILDIDIMIQGKTFIIEGNKKTAMKVPEELAEEAEVLSKKVYELLENGTISQAEWKKYQKSLFYVYEYFISISLGEQLFAPKLSDREYEKLRKEAEIKNTSFQQQLEKLKQEKSKQFKLVQSYQQEYYQKEKTKIK